MERNINRHTTASYSLKDLAHQIARRALHREGRKAYKRGAVPLCPYGLHDGRSTTWKEGWTESMLLSSLRG